MWKPSLAAVALVFFNCIGPTIGQNCFAVLQNILLREDKVTNTATTRTYTLCGGTTFNTGLINTNGGFVNQGGPLSVKANSRVKCGANGSSKNNCVIKGTGLYAIFIDPNSVFSNQGQSLGTITLQGITVDGFGQSTNKRQFPVVVGGFSGKVVFEDCVFRNNQVEALFFVDQYFNGGRRVLESQPFFNATRSSGPRWNFQYYPGPETRFGDHIINDDPENGGDNTSVTVTSGNRQLQANNRLIVEFKNCVFDSNSPGIEPVSQNGLSLVRFRARSPPSVVNSNPNSFREFVAGTLDATFTKNIFRNNNFNVAGDKATYRSMIDFYSRGTLVLQENCFQTSPVKNFGVVTIQPNTNLVHQNNFLAGKQSNLRCDFIARVDTTYLFKQCGPKALANSCRATAAAPSFCFPGDVSCEVEGKGEVPMKEIKLGDKVLVASGKYETIYSFGHYAPQRSSEYIQLVTRMGKLELSKDHMVFLEGGRAVPASIVKVGDMVEAASGSYNVTNIRLVNREGLYAPFTPSGTLIVNGFKSSSFVSFQESATLKITRFDTGLTYQFLALAFETPHRTWCQYFSTCKAEKYTVDGISVWVAFAYKAALWYFDQSDIVTSILAIPGLVLFGILAYPMTFLVLVLSILVGRRVQFRVKS